MPGSPSLLHGHGRESGNGCQLTVFGARSGAQHTGFGGHDERIFADNVRIPRVGPGSD